MTTGRRLRVSTKRRQTIELLHDFFELILSFLKIEVTTDDRILACEFDNLLAIKVVQQP